jgi:hypothetical protein
LYEDDEKILLTDILEIHFVELPKFLENSTELNSSLNKWLAFLTKPEKEEDALNFLRLGVSEDIVAKGTGLSNDKI